MTELRDHDMQPTTDGLRESVRPAPSLLERRQPSSSETLQGEKQDPADRKAMRPGINWCNLVFIGIVHALAIVAVVLLVMGSFSWATIGLGALWYVLCGLSITAGYHRLFSHAAYKAHPLLRTFYLLFGAASFQNSALAWSADHRAHHADTDGPSDPYSVTRGFWWSHVGWVLFQGGSSTSRVKDLEADQLVRFQHRFWMPLGALFGFALPMALAAIWHEALGGLLLAGFLRLAVQWHATFCVNSVAHIFGRQPYSTKGTARDNVITAFATFGEGYHNYHHHFPRDYRCGIHWFDFDPTKWWIRLLGTVGLARTLRRAPASYVERARARVREARAALTAPAALPTAD